MPNPIEVLSLSEFERLLDAWTPARRITEVHVHCTDHPRHAEFRGRASVEAMRAYHQSIGMADIAQHVTIDPQGLIWTGRPFDERPASVRGHNGTPAAGPFMIEMVGLFEAGADTFQGDQKNTAYAVVRAVLEKCDLKETAVRFHREFPNTGKTCPGRALTPGAFRADIKALLADNTLRSFDVAVPRHMPRGSIERAVAANVEARPEPDYLEVPEYADALDEQRVLTRLIEQGRLIVDEGAGSRGADEEFRDLIGHAVNTSQGILSGKGAMHNTTSDLDTLVRDHLAPQFASGAFEHLLFYAHGGLVGEKSALRYARTMLPWWKSHKVYPIFFIWESSLFQSIWKQPRGQRGLTDFSDKGVELATQTLARPIWAAMKTNARRCSAPTTEFGQPGGVFELTQRLLPWLQANPTVKLHAVGHSAGPILLTRFMPLLVSAGHTFESLSYLAPALRTDDYANEVVPLLKNGRVKRMRVLTMGDKAERDDNVVGVYRKSLLYYVRDACEDKTDGRLLGLQKDLLDDPTLRDAFSISSKRDLRGPANYKPGAAIAIEFSQRGEDEPANDRTVATAHGAFDNDPVTMRSVLANVLGTATVGHAGDRFPTAETLAATLDPDDDARSLDVAYTDETACACTCDCCRRAPAQGVSAFDDDREPSDVDEADAGRADAPVGRRKAVCIGIDTYPTMPLEGCVNDARAWQQRLKKAGFTVTTLLNDQATRDRMLAALTSLIKDSRSGDQLVFQYAGHGTQVDDLNGDEVDPLDEALVPFDYTQGHLLIDDDIYAACALLRERPGVTLTFFMDCCNSGSNTRVAAVPRAGQGQRVRFLKMPADVVRKYRGVRAGQRAAAASMPRGSEREPQPGVVTFAACLDHEFAFESGGSGDFTTRAADVFEATLRDGGSNQAFITGVVKAFGASRRQNPTMLDPVPGLKTRRFLGGR